MDILHHFLPAVTPLLYFIVLFGLVGVAACFMIGIPLVATLLITLWGGVMGERAMAGARGTPSGSDLPE